MKKSLLIRKLVILLGNLELEKKKWIRLVHLIKWFGSTTSAYFVLNYLQKNEIITEDEKEEGVYWVNLQKLRDHINELLS